MIVAGIDPGYGRCGYGIIKHEGQNSSLIDFGCIETDSSLPHPQRLQTIYNRLTDVFKKYNPEKIGVEELFFSKNTKTALKVAEARGLILLAIEQSGLRPIELSPNAIKQALTGYGSADKKQMQDMVRLILKLETVPKPDDAADALAIALATATWQDYSQ